MEMDTFRRVSILHFLSMITPQYHHIFFILWNSLSFSSKEPSEYTGVGHADDVIQQTIYY